jgi:hypothetical protein
MASVDRSVGRGGILRYYPIRCVENVSNAHNGQIWSSEMYINRLFVNIFNSAMFLFFGTMFVCCMVVPIDFNVVTHVDPQIYPITFFMLALASMGLAGLVTKHD